MNLLISLCACKEGKKINKLSCLKRKEKVIKKARQYLFRKLKESWPIQGLVQSGLWDVLLFLLM